MEMAKKGDWVQIHKRILTPEERAPQVPEDTKLVPLELWVKGELTSDAKIGDAVEIITVTGRRVSGTLISINPKYIHDFGDFIPELLQVGKQLKRYLHGEKQI